MNRIEHNVAIMSMASMVITNWLINIFSCFKEISNVCFGLPFLTNYCYFSEKSWHKCVSLFDFVFFLPIFFFEWRNEEISRSSMSYWIHEAEYLLDEKLISRFYEGLNTQYWNWTHLWQMQATKLTNKQKTKWNEAYWKWKVNKRRVSDQ